MSSTKEKKSAFLRSKGLTQPEIDEAFRRAGSFHYSNEDQPLWKIIF